MVRRGRKHRLCKKRSCLPSPITPPRSSNRRRIIDTNHLAAIPSALISLGLISSFPALASDSVLSTSPANAVHDVERNTDLSATLTGDQTANLNPDSFVVRASQTDWMGPNSVSGVGTSTITANPYSDFHPGERVQATVTSAIQTSQGSIKRHSWSFRVRVNEGDGIFYESDNSLGNSRSSDVELGDLDGDGDLDAFVANRNYEANRVWLNDGNASFVDSGNSLGSSYSLGVALGDLDNDGDLDALVSNINGTPSKAWLNDGNANFSSPGQLSSYFSHHDVALGDVDLDGDLDVFLAASGNHFNEVWLNSGNGTFIDRAETLGASNSTEVSLGDLDNDGDLDAWVTNRANQPNHVWFNTNGSMFLDSGADLGSAYSNSVDLGDLDADGDLDAWVANYGQNTIWLNNGSGDFTESSLSFDSTSSYHVSLGDIDGDDDLDAFVANGRGEPNIVYVNDGNGQYVESGQSLGNSQSDGVALGDLDGDGDLDAFVSNIDQPNRVWLNGGITDSISIDGSVDRVIFSPGDTLNYTFSISNNTDSAITDVEATIEISNLASFSVLDCQLPRCEVISQTSSEIVLMVDVLAGETLAWSGVGQTGASAAFNGAETASSVDCATGVFAAIRATKANVLVLNNERTITSSCEPPDDEAALVGVLNSVDTISTSKRTVILTHGLSKNNDCADPSENNYQTSLWTGTGRDELAASLIDEQTSSNINVIQFVWPGGCTVGRSGLPTRQNYVDAWVNIHQAARGLADGLLASLTNNYNQDIQFIGHSLGTIVNAYAAKYFVEGLTIPDGQTRDVQFTVLDHPFRVTKILGFSTEDEKEFGFDQHFFSRVLPHNKTKINLKVDNYYATPQADGGASSAAVGETLCGLASYNRVLDAPGKVADHLFPDERSASFLGVGNDHSGVHQWYRWTIKYNNGENLSGNSVCEIPGISTSWNAEPFGRTFFLERYKEPTLNPCDYGWHRSSVADSGIGALFSNNSCPANATGAESAVTGGTTSSTGCVIVGDPLSYVCAESAPPTALDTVEVENTDFDHASSVTVATEKYYAEAEVSVPEFLRFVTFDYLFDDIGDGDFVTIFLDGNPLWKIQGGAVTQGAIVSSGPVPARVGPGPRKLVVALYGVGDANADFTVNNFLFVAAVDTDSDGVPDDEDAFPNDGTETDDADSDGIGDNTDPDDDNDGLTDVVENGNALLNPLDPDSDKDEIIDGIDRDPTSDSNNICLGMGVDAMLNFSTSDATTCAAKDSISATMPAGVTNTGDLLLIAPHVNLEKGFYVKESGKLKIISQDPTVPSEP